MIMLLVDLFVYPYDWVGYGEVEGVANPENAWFNLLQIHVLSRYNYSAYKRAQLSRALICFFLSRFRRVYFIFDSRAQGIYIYLDHYVARTKIISPLFFKAP